jgi:hypothetical protein
MLFYVCDHWSGPVEDQHRPRVFYNTLLKIVFILNQQEETGGNVIRMICIKCTVLRVTRAELCWTVREIIILVGKPECMNGLGVSRHV